MHKQKDILVKLQQELDKFRVQKPFLKELESINQELKLKKELLEKETLKSANFQSEVIRLNGLLKSHRKVQNNLTELQDPQLKFQNEWQDLQNSYLKLQEERNSLQTSLLRLEKNLQNRNENQSDLLQKYHETLEQLAIANKNLESIFNTKAWRAVKFWWEFKNKALLIGLEKKRHINQLALSTQYLWKNQGTVPLLKQIFRFLKGERRNGQFGRVYDFEKSKSKISMSQNVSKEITYDEWILQNEPSQQELELQKSQELEFQFRPLISILTPVYNTDIKMLQEMIESVLSQTYSNWELCLIDGGSTKPQVRMILKSFAESDERIKVKFLDQNFGIAGNSNQGLSMINGEYTALLDHDDLLSQNALFEIAKLLNESQELDFIYSDKDTISADGKQRYNPLFKPKWSPDILFNANYLTHLNVIRTKLLKELKGGFDQKADGAQDWDIFLRVTSITNQIAHVPQILYHWRAHPESTALKLEAKPYAISGQLYCIEKFLSGNGINANVTFNKFNMPQVEWQSGLNQLISIIIDVNCNIKNLNCIINDKEIYSLFPNIEFIILNRSNIKLPIEADDKIKILDFSPFSPLGKIYQAGVNFAKGQTLVFLDADLKPFNASFGSSVYELVNWAQMEGIGSVGGMLLYPDEVIAGTGLILEKDAKVHAFGEGLRMLNGSLLGHLVWYRNFSALPRHCFVLRKDVIDAVGGFNVEQNLSCHIDLSFRISNLKLRHFYTPNAILQFQTTQKIDWQILQDDFSIFPAHEEFFKNIDPYFNSNLEFINGRLGFRSEKSTKCDK